MLIRKTDPNDLDSIMEIYASAQRFMVRSGNPNQWKAGHPSRAMIKEDIELGRHYVCEIDGRIECVFMYYYGIDPTYLVIEDGNWPNDKPYGTMHRIASAGNIKRIADFCLNWCFEQCRNLRADTHEDNKVMQNVLTRNGFVRCGIIHIEDGSSRIAYQKTE